MEQHDPLAGRKALVAARTALIKHAKFTSEVIEISAEVAKILHSKIDRIDNKFIEKLIGQLQNCPYNQEVHVAVELLRGISEAERSF